MSPRPASAGGPVATEPKVRFIPTVIKNDRWYESLFGAPPPANPARDTNRRNRWKSQRFRRLVSDRDSGWGLACSHGRAKSKPVPTTRPLASSPPRQTGSLIDTGLVGDLRLI